MGDDYFLCSPLIFTAVMENFWLYIISPAFTAFLSWFFTRRTYKQEIRKMKQDNDESGYEYLKKLNDDLESRVAAISEQSEKLFNQVLELTNENRELKVSITELKSNIAELTKRLQSYES